MVCPFLEYRPLDASASGVANAAGVANEDAADLPDEPRAYCTAADRFVQPLRADICNDRDDLVHDQDCEIFREHADDIPESHNPSDGDPP